MSNVETLSVAASDSSSKQGRFEPLTADETRKMNAYWRACNYLSAGMLYLCSNPLLREPLKPEHIKNRLLGHWGSDPGQSFIWVHMNRLIKKYDLNMIYLSGPGPWSSCDPLQLLSRRGVFRDLPGQKPGCGRTAQVPQAVLIPWRHREPLHSGNPGVDS